MKMVVAGAVFLLLGICCLSTAFAVEPINNTIYFVGVEDSLALEMVQGFGFELEGAAPENVWYQISYQSDGGAVPGAEGSPWTIGPSGLGFNGSDTSLTGSPLVEGIVMAVGGGIPFALNTFSLLSDGGAYPYSFAVDYDADTRTYWLSGSSVPIPPNILLLASGLVGLFGWRRRHNS